MTKNPYTTRTREIAAPEILYHYCSAEAFKSIIESKSLWLTDSTCTNDYTENRIFFEYVRHALQELVSAVPDAEERERRMDKANSFFNMFTAQYSHILIASFSELRDDLSQWRGYAEEGFAIGFETREMKLSNELPYAMSILSENSPGLLKVLYLPEEKEKQDAFVAEIKQSIDLGLDLIEITMAIRKLTELCLCSKSPAFAKEQEWRIVHTPIISPYIHGYVGKNSHSVMGAISELKYRNTQYGLSSYCEWPFPLCEEEEEKLSSPELNCPAPYPPTKPVLCNVIKEVIIGPKNKSHIHNVTHFMQHNGFFIKPENVRCSGQPYR